MKDLKYSVFINHSNLFSERICTFCKLSRLFRSTSDPLEPIPKLEKSMDNYHLGVPANIDLMLMKVAYHRL